METITRYRDANFHCLKESSNIFTLPSLSINHKVGCISSFYGRVTYGSERLGDLPGVAQQRRAEPSLPEPRTSETRLLAAGLAVGADNP